MEINWGGALVGFQLAVVGMLSVVPVLAFSVWAVGKLVHYALQLFWYNSEGTIFDGQPEDMLGDNARERAAHEDRIRRGDFNEH